MPKTFWAGLGLPLPIAPVVGQPLGEVPLGPVGVVDPGPENIVA